MKIEITYNTNSQIWAIEDIAAAHGYRKTQECYWVQIFENANGDSIVTTRNDGELLNDPVKRLEAILTPAAEEAQEAAEEAQTIYSQMTAELEARKDRSAWDRGVNVYALELVEELEERSQYEGRTPATRKECEAWLLNGAQDWKAFSWGGSSLIYNGDIARRLCCPSELKKTRNGERRPNSREEWLDTQARALFQASRLVLGAYEASRPCDDDGEPLPQF